ncbi:helix-turn-helix transcriptional regulator [Vallitalea okinawensis]|uniref:helix-turn-helix transcriptional regulator n=1 Tax=Vallitalea okinawensis TaxID=2078660 RepID=UPI001FA91C44|nr:YafY family protein [Vallitalea okinawensis]
MERLIGIIYALKEHDKLTARDLADLFEVSHRTIYRDIDALSQLNVPIIALEGNGGGYQINDNYFLPSVTFNNNELLYLLICLKMGEIIKVPNMKQDYESLKYKLLNILDDDKEEYLKLLDRIIFHINRLTPNSYENTIMYTIIQSFLGNNDINVSYYIPKREEVISRRITPYTLEFDGGGWYLQAYCHLRQAKRCFRLDRIHHIEKTDILHDECLYKEFIEHRYDERQICGIELEIDKGLFQTMQSDEMFMDTEILSNDSRMCIKFNTPYKEDILELAFFESGRVKILQPKSLKEELKDMCMRAYENYSKT